MKYFSDIENGPKPRTEECIQENAWRGIISIIQSAIVNGGFGEKFPHPVEDHFGDRLKSHVNIEWPPNKYDVPEIFSVLDLIQFCHDHVAKCIHENRDYFTGRYEIRYDTTAGKDEFRAEINMIFSRNGLAYQLQEDGFIIRLGPPVLREKLIQSQFDTGESELDRMLEEACRKAIDPHPESIRAAVEKLWDAWQRLITIESPDPSKNRQLKPQLINDLLNRAASEPHLRAVITEDANKLKEIGSDKFQIRHFETDKIKIEHSYQLEYLFYRLLNLIWLVLQAKNIASIVED